VSEWLRGSRLPVRSKMRVKASLTSSLAKSGDGISPQKSRWIATMTSTAPSSTFSELCHILVADGVVPFAFLLLRRFMHERKLSSTNVK